MTLALSIRELEKTYDNGFVALRGINLDVRQGDFFALLGPNGAGKSTAIGIVCSLVNKTSGNVSIFGTDIDDNFAKAKSFLGIVPQEFNFSIFETPLQIVLNQAGYYGIHRSLARQRAERYLQQLSIWDKRNEPMRNLSGGMKRRLLIARALIHQPKLLILDEPTAGVDIEIRRSMWEFLKQINETGTTIILTTHYLEEAESLCRNIAIIDHGKLVKNTSMKQLLAQLNVETFLLDIEKPQRSLANTAGLDMKLLDDTTIEVNVEKNQGINAVFTQLSQQNIRVLSMRNKANRLEQLFMSLVQGDNAETHQSHTQN